MQLNTTATTTATTASSLSYQIDPIIYNTEIKIKSESSNDFDIFASKQILIPSNLNYHSSTSPGSISSISSPMVDEDGLGVSAIAADVTDGSQLNTIETDGQDNLDIDFNIELNDDDLEETTNPSSTTILFFEMMQDFPDLSSFVCHQDFNSFARIWLDYQRNIHLAQHLQHRSDVLAWLKAAALQLHFCLVTLVRSSPKRNDEATSMFSAFRRLKDRVEIMYSVINIVENGRKIGQTPLEAIAPLVNQADEIQRNVNYFNQEQNVIPMVNQDTNLVELRNSNQVQMSNLSKGLISTYNMMPYDNDQTASAVTSFDSIVCSIQAQSTANDNTIMPIDHSNLTSFQPAEELSNFASGSSTPAFYVPNNIYSSISRLGFETPLSNTSCSSTPLQHPVLFSHIEPSWIYSPQVNWYSLPVSPSTEHSTQKFLSSPGSPTCAQQDAGVAEEGQKEEATVGSIQAPCNTCDEELFSFSPTCDTLTTVSPINTFSHSEEEDEDDDGDDEQEQAEEYQTPSTQDEDYSQLSDMEDDDDEWMEPSTIKRQQYSLATIATTTATATGRRNRKPGPNTKELRKRVAVTGAQKTRRTATSYDAKTTHYLKSIFFDIYSTKDKLTKDQRRKVQQETGLKPRNITYWFSNHKRRFQHSLTVFKQTVQETQGKVKTYDDFLIYRRINGLPEEVQEGEFLDDKGISF
jgi:hypothetical protein